MVSPIPGSGSTSGTGNTGSTGGGSSSGSGSPTDTIGSSNQSAFSLTPLEGRPSLIGYLSSIAESTQSHRSALDGAAQAIANVFSGTKSNIILDSSLAAGNVISDDYYRPLVPAINKAYQDIATLEADYNAFVTGTTVTPSRNTSIYDYMYDYTAMLATLDTSLKNAAANEDPTLDINDPKYTTSNPDYVQALAAAGLPPNTKFSDLLKAAVGQPKYDNLVNAGLNNESVVTQVVIPDGSTRDFTQDISFEALIGNQGIAPFTAIDPNRTSIFSLPGRSSGLTVLLQNPLNIDYQTLFSGNNFSSFYDGVYRTYSNTFAPASYSYDITGNTTSIPDPSWTKVTQFSAVADDTPTNDLIAVLNYLQLSGNTAGTSAGILSQFYKDMALADIDLDGITVAINTKLNEFIARATQINSDINAINAEALVLGAGKSVVFPPISSSFTGLIVPDFQQFLDLIRPPSINMSLIGYTISQQPYAQEGLWAIYPSTFGLVNLSGQPGYSVTFPSLTATLSPAYSYVIGVINSLVSTGGLIAFLDILLTETYLRAVSNRRSAEETAPNGQKTILPDAFITEAAILPQISPALGPGAGSALGNLGGANNASLNAAISAALNKAVQTLERSNFEDTYNPRLEGIGKSIGVLVNFYLSQSATLAAGGAISLLGDNSGQFNTRSEAVPVALAIKFAELLNLDQSTVNLSGNIRALLATALPQITPNELTSLTNFLTAAAQFNLLNASLSQLAQSIGDPELVAKLFASLPNAQILKASFDASQTTSIQDALRNEFSRSTLIAALAAIAPAQGTIIRESVRAIAQNREIQTQEQLRSAFVTELTVRSGGTIDTATVNTLSNQAVTFIQAETLSGYLLDTEIQQETLNSELLSQEIQKQGIDRAIANAAAATTVNTLNNIPLDTFPLPPISQRVARDTLAEALASNGIGPDQALLAATLAVIGSQTQGAVFTPYTPQQIQADLISQVKEKLTASLGETKAAQIAEEFATTTLDLRSKLADTIDTLTKYDSGKYTDKLQDAVKDSLKYTTDSVLVNLKIFSEGKTALGIMSDHHPLGNINQGVSQMKRFIDVQI